MTDLETLRAMFDRADVRYDVNETTTGNEQHPATTQMLETAGGIGPDHCGAGNRGYIGFYTAFGFDDAGTLLWVGAWE